LAHKYQYLALYLVLRNVKDSFVPFISNLQKLKLPNFLSLPKELPQILPIIINHQLLVKADLFNENEDTEADPAPSPKM
jgi:hypothetical protein